MLQQLHDDDKQHDTKKHFRIVDLAYRLKDEDDLDLKELVPEHVRAVHADVVDWDTPIFVHSKLLSVQTLAI